MPQIKNYNARIGSPEPVAPSRNRGEDTSTGRGIAQFGAALSDVAQTVHKRKVQQVQSTTSARIAQKRAELTINAQEMLRKADPNDTEIAARINEMVDKGISEVEEGVETSEGWSHFETLAGDLKAHFLQSAYQSQIELAGQKAKIDYTQTRDNLSASVINDPSGHDLALKHHDMDLDARVANGSLPKVVAEQLKAEGRSKLTKNAVQGWIKLDPYKAQNELKAGRWDQYLNGDEKHQLFSEARQNILAMEVEGERRKKLERDALEKKQKETQNTFLEKMHKGELSAQEIFESNLDGFGSGSKDVFLRLLKETSTEKQKTDPATFNSLVQRIHLPDGDPKKIVDDNDLISFVGKGLTLADVNQLRNEMQGQNTEAGAYESKLKAGVLEIAKSKMTKSNPMLGIRDPEGDELFQKWQAQFFRDFIDGRKAGKSARQLLVPGSPDYIGENIHARSPHEIMKSITRANRPRGTPSPLLTPSPTPTPTPRPQMKEGESTSDYLKRVRGGS